MVAEMDGEAGAEALRCDVRNEAEVRAAMA
jgi:hypothetical protein